jgi:cytochrome c peroxidase
MLIVWKKPDKAVKAVESYRALRCAVRRDRNGDGMIGYHKQFIYGLIIPAIAFLASCSGCSGGASQELEGTDLVIRIMFKPLPAKMPGSSEDTADKVALGRKLYFERSISLLKSQSCNDCHKLQDQQAGVDNLPTSKGDKGQFGKRNSPTVLNAGFQIAQFWDGRSGDLAEQAKGPILNPVEMAMRSPEEVVGRLKKMKDYPGLFELAFPDEEEPVTYDNIGKAIAAFERTLITPSRFDRYLRGQSDAITLKEKQGLYKFVETGCYACHSSYTVGGRIFMKFGMYHPYKNQMDLGRFEVTHQEGDKLVFKVPMLRNITLTPPYFHDGQVSTLPEAVRLMAWMQLDKPLSSHEIDEIVGFFPALEAENPVSIAGQ